MREGSVREAIEEALAAMEVRPEYAVPCLDRDCRTICATRDAAIELAETKGGLIETRLAAPWRPE